MRFRTRKRPAIEVDESIPAVWTTRKPTPKTLRELRAELMKIARSHPKHKHSTEASASASVERPGTSVVSPTTVPGHPYDPDDERRRISRDEVWARRDHQTMVDVCNRIDIVEQDNAILACENARLRRELDLACGERDDARARISGMTL